MNLLDCRRIALIGRCLVKKHDFDWYMPIENQDFDWYMPIEFRDFNWYMPIEICLAVFELAVLGDDSFLPVEV